MALDGRPSRINFVTNPGPYEAIVVSQLDPKRMGSLQVELLKSSVSGNQAERSGQIVTVKYLSPFAGQTPLNAVSNNDTFQATQKSYGFWMVPPDPGTKVLVIFAEGNIGRGYWIGCVQDTYMNFMTPDPWSGSEYNSLEQGRPLPVGEFNKAAQSGAGTDPTRYTKPYNPDFYTILARQGLVDDDVRGPANSSARREVPSTVFGFSTPGPIDKRQGAPKAARGPQETRTQVFASRLGGSSLVLDDGDDTRLRKGFASQSPMEYGDLTQDDTSGFVQLPANELVRLRTRTGHQILMHNTEDLIYIGNAAGSTWIEMTANGKIDIYAQDSVSIRTQNDLNISADRDINMTASRDINLNAGRDFKLTVSQNSDVKVGVNHKLDVGANHDTFVGATQKIFVGADNNLIVTGPHLISSQATLDINTTGARKDSQESFDISTSGDNKLTAGGNTDILSGGNHTETAAQIHMNGPGASEAATAGTAAQAEVAAPALWPVRVPVHEPWLGHEHLDPGTFTPQYTQAAPNPSPALRETTPLINSDSDAGVFNQNNQNTANVNGPQTVVPGEVGPIGDQPAMPVPINDMQRYYIHVLITGYGFDPATALNSADPSKNPEGVPTGHAEFIAGSMGHIQRECGFKPQSENLNYSASRLRQVFPSRVRSDAFAQELAAAGPAAIGNTIYGGRFGNAQNEGYKYRGRGLIQITFRGNYERYGRLSGHPEIIENPDLANDPEIAAALAVAYLKDRYKGDTNGFNMEAHAIDFQKAIGYGAPGAETPQRLASARGFLAKILNGELTPITSLTTEPAGTNIEAGNRAPDDGLRG